MDKDVVLLNVNYTMEARTMDLWSYRIKLEDQNYGNKVHIIQFRQF